MDQPKSSLSAPASGAAGQFLPLLVLLFVGSGCAALVYEIVWLQMLQLLIGSNAVSLGVLLGTFMGGMCLGSLALPWVIPRSVHPLRAYAYLEIGIGIIGIVIWYAMPWISHLYTDAFAGDQSGIFLRGLVAGVCLLPPTVLMGATLPAIARWVETSREGVSWLGFFYGGNIAGAVFGCLLAGFYLLRVHDMMIATFVAATINAAVALIALALASQSEYRPAASDSPDSRPERVPFAWTIYIAIALSGLTALGAEVIWTRLISLLLGGTVYTFSIILAVFLFGLGIGSGLGAATARSVRSPRLALGVCQILIALAIAWTSFMMSDSLPYWPVDPALSAMRSDSPRAAWGPWINFQLDIVRAMWAVLPGTILWGASFPLALAAVAGRGQDPGRLVGGVYAANTVGAIIGSLAFAMFIIPARGTLFSQQLLVGIAVASSWIVLAPLLWQWLLAPQREGAPRTSPAPAPAAAAGLAIFVVLGTMAAAYFGSGLKNVPWALVAFGRQMATWEDFWRPEKVSSEEAADRLVGRGREDTFCLYVGEGMNVSVAVTYDDDGWRYFHGAGKVQASSMPDDMRLQRLLGHISALANKDPKNVLVVACGAGVTAGSFLVHPEVEKLTICDIEPLVPQVVTPYFTKENYGVTDGVDKQNPRNVRGKEVLVVYDDGRHFIRTTKEKYDVISSDPIDPWVKGCAALNTVEYYQMCYDHLNPGGVMSLWIPFYESNADTAKTVIATFLEVFDDGIVWSNDINGRGYDAVLFGVKPNEDGSKFKINVDELIARYNQDDHADLRESLADVGFRSAIDVLATYAGSGDQLRKWSAGADINRDRNLRLQFLAGMWFNTFMETEILDGILEHYAFPRDDLFVGSEANLGRLERSLQQAGRAKFADFPNPQPPSLTQFILGSE